jgi:hypothetical protein
MVLNNPNDAPTNVGSILCLVHLFTLAVENHLGHYGLLEAEMNFLSTVPINWRDVMLPAAKQPQQQSA